jgi:(2Fe-2S) ferredoxin
MRSATYRVYICHGPSCSPRAGALLRALESELWTRGLEGQIELGSGGCLGRCAEGPNLVIYPGPVYCSGLTRETLRTIVDRHLSHGSS